MNILNIFSRFVLLMVGVAVANSAYAVTLSSAGMGQVLIYPYYTVNADQHSTLTLSNTTDQAKAVKLVIRDGALGRAVFALDVYLSPQDTWSGTLGELGSGASAGPVLVSSDTSCTVPDLHSHDLPSLPGGRHYLQPNAGDLVAESVPDEGYVVAIEMGELGGDIADKIRPHYIASSGTYAPPECNVPVGAWRQGGVWDKDASVDIAPPAGGLSGTMTILNVGNGTLFRVDATALKDFRVAPMHTAPTATKPDLGDALSDADTGMASATIRIGDNVIHSEYPADRAIDAVTAALMAQKFATNYDLRSTIGARTAIIATMPTKRFYVAGEDKVIAPFGSYGFQITSSSGTRCSVVDMNAFYALDPYYWRDLSGQSLAEAAPLPCYATSVLSMASAHPLLSSQLPWSHDINPNLHPLVGPVVLWMNNSHACCSQRNLMRPDMKGRQYVGLPVVGFAASGYINANAGQQGIWRHYTFTSPFHRSRACKQDGEVGSCH